LDFDAGNLAAIALTAALALALGFHRNRAVQVLLALLALAAALAAAEPRYTTGALRFVPWFVLAAALLPEPRLISRRNAVLLLFALVFSGIVLRAPEHVFAGLVAAFAWLVGGASETLGAAAVLGIAAVLCLARWAMTARPMEFGLALVIGTVAIALLPGSGGAPLAGLALAGALALLAVLYSSYRMAFIDGLTGLPNRRALDETLMRLGGDYALAMVDVDHFKQFNDTYGHNAGDIVLRQVARLLARRACGDAYRYGGEEFCVVYQGRRTATAKDGCERARQAVQEQRIAIVKAPKRARSTSENARAKTSEVSVTISIGCAARASDRRSAAEVLKAADQALYKAKSKGRNRVVAI
jgi:diguanylate cyclase (GGDEF)-like protein